MHPHPALIDLAAGRRMGPVDDAYWLLRSAAAHRMECILASELQQSSIRLGGGLDEELIAFDLRSRAQYRKVERTLGEVLERLGPLADCVALYKGVAAAERWFSTDPSARPCVDVDLFVDPHRIDSFDEVVCVLDPKNELLGHIVPLIRSGYLRLVEVELEGILVDIHVDPMNLAVHTRQANLVWDRTIWSSTRAGHRVRTLDPTFAAVQIALNGLRDNFAHLLQVMELHRAMNDPEVDLQEASRFVEEEGWTRLWRKGARAARMLEDGDAVGLRHDGSLLGNTTWSHSRFREYLLPAWGDGRMLNLTNNLARRTMVPKVVLAARAPDLGGPYLARLMRYRASRNFGSGGQTDDR